MPAIPSAKERSRNAVAQKAHRERKRAYIQQLEDKIRHYEQQGVPTSEQERLHQLESENAALRAEVEALKAERASPVSPVPSTSSSLDSLPTSTPAFPLLGALDSTDPLSSAASDSASACFFRAIERSSRAS
ncbi:hypothetical protein BCR35DRAFT_306282 [Leucosporidium creatinivorum]|uniref:BZIP domain-containing protein n=1 Tax=Leucosporidium creatinivorum TaxID=106004 RepID=A0A1Y2EUT1_9BASI|nr:hypothetical protein BCR35DRAFT_306282 [Leucosporidium creatinivorum]